MRQAHPNIERGGMGGQSRDDIFPQMCVYLSNTSTTVERQGGSGRSARKISYVNNQHTMLEDNDPTGYKSNEAKEVKAALKIHPLEFPARRHFRTSGRVCSKDHAKLKNSACSSPVLANASEDLAPRRCSSIVRTPPVPN